MLQEALTGPSQWKVINRTVMPLVSSLGLICAALPTCRVHALVCKIPSKMRSHELVMFVDINLMCYRITEYYASWQQKLGDT